MIYLREVGRFLIVVGAFVALGLWVAIVLAEARP